MSKLIDDVYTGAIASKYDAERENTQRWTREAAVIVPLLKTIPKGSSVVDIAAGTGRWLPVYKERELSVFLSDASAEMLAISEMKARELGFEVSVRRQSAMGPEPFPEGETAVISSFLNWISQYDVETVFRKLLESKAERYLFMISYLPDDWSAIRKARARFRILWKSIRTRLGLRKKGYYHLHDEADIRVMFRRLGIEIDQEHVITEGDVKRVAFMDARRIRELPIKVIEEVVLTSDESAIIDGREYSINAGAWAFYVPELELKILRASAGKCAYKHARAPDPNCVRNMPPEQANGNYTNGDWVSAIDKSVYRRAAEICVAAQKLARHGLGPAVQGAVVVRSFRQERTSEGGPSAGMVVDNLLKYPVRRKVLEEEMLAAGVEPDRIRASLRQQIRGHISDLNSVIGVVPIMAEPEVNVLKSRLEKAI